MRLQAELHKMARAALQQAASVGDVGQHLWGSGEGFCLGLLGIASPEFRALSEVSAADRVVSMASASSAASPLGRTALRSRVSGPPQ